MIKLLIAGVWVCVVTLGATYGALSLSGPKDDKDVEANYFAGLSSERTNLVSIPIIRDSEMQGYVLAEFAYVVDAKKVKKMAVHPKVFLLDAMIRNIYGDSNVDFRDLKKQDVDKLLKTLRDEVNQRYGKKIVKDVLVGQLTYLDKDSVRSANGKQKKLPKPGAKKKK